MPDFSKPIPEEELHARYWMLSHLGDIRRLGLYIFIGIDAIICLVVLAYLVNLYGIQLLSYPRALSEMAQPLRVTSSASQLVSPLNALDVGALPSGTDRSDLYAQIENTNPAYMARFTYSFLYNGAAQGNYQGYIYPGEQKYLLGLALPSAGTNTPQLQLTNIRWTKLSPKEIETEKAERAVTADSFSFTQAGPGLPFSRLTFTLKNPTGYLYNHIALPVVLRYAGRVVAVNYTIVDNVMSNQTRTVDLRWFAPVSVADTYVVSPDIDVFDPNTFLTPPPEVPATPSDQ